mmetsp:Transcript_38413/g.115111  ORF Transcript_38413/g.115111 Transcript_38413/m.115111 type:complete len:216 (+) Transcript_38413:1728-2375(+)
MAPRIDHVFDLHRPAKISALRPRHDLPRDGRSQLVEFRRMARRDGIRMRLVRGRVRRRRPDRQVGPVRQFSQGSAPRGDRTAQGHPKESGPVLERHQQRRVVVPRSDDGARGAGSGGERAGGDDPHRASLVDEDREIVPVSQRHRGSSALLDLQQDEGIDGAEARGQRAQGNDPARRDGDLGRGQAGEVEAFGQQARGVYSSRYRGADSAQRPAT